jgi:tRNA nucleotidyltransferase (CCA-adding enzyme)
MRRDLTLNALFYNINEQKVEDFTGRGIDDLRNKIARTPLPPHQTLLEDPLRMAVGDLELLGRLQTFLDDPLRILRSIRFAVKYNLQMVKEIKEAAANQEVRDALVQKVTNERRAKELN